MLWQIFLLQQIWGSIFCSYFIADYLIWKYNTPFRSTIALFLLELDYEFAFNRIMSGLNRRSALIRI